MRSHEDVVRNDRNVLRENMLCASLPSEQCKRRVDCLPIFKTRRNLRSLGCRDPCATSVRWLMTEFGVAYCDERPESRWRERRSRKNFRWGQITQGETTSCFFHYLEESTVIMMQRTTTLFWMATTTWTSLHALSIADWRIEGGRIWRSWWTTSSVQDFFGQYVVCWTVESRK